MTSQTHRFEAFVVCSALADSLTLQRHHRQPVVVDPRPEVVVGVDGLPGALKAVTWGLSRPNYVAYPCGWSMRSTRRTLRRPEPGACPPGRTTPL